MFSNKQFTYKWGNLRFIGAYTESICNSTEACT